jgi:hypothetical protein
MLDLTTTGIPALDAQRLHASDIVAHARLQMLAADAAYCDAADEYRSAVQAYMHGRRASGASQRHVAKELGITEATLRDLLRPVRRRR